MNAEREVLQKLIAPSISDKIVEQGYDHIGGSVVRAADVAELATPISILDAWQLAGDASPFGADPEHVDVLRFRTHPLMSLSSPLDAPLRPWPTYPNGFLGGDVVAPVWILDRTRVPAGAELWRIGRDGAQHRLALFTGPARGWSGGRGYAPPVQLVGTRAKWRDLDVPADLVDDDRQVELALVAEAAPHGFEQVRHGVWARRVPIGDVTQLFELVITGHYRDVPCRILHHGPERSRLLLLTDDPAVAQRLSAEPVDIGAFEVTALTAELADVAGTSRESADLAPTGR